MTPTARADADGASPAAPTSVGAAPRAENGSQTRQAARTAAQLLDVDGRVDALEVEALQSRGAASSSSLAIASPRGAQPPAPPAQPAPRLDTCTGYFPEARASDRVFAQVSSAQFVLPLENGWQWTLPIGRDGISKLEPPVDRPAAAEPARMFESDGGLFRAADWEQRVLEGLELGGKAMRQEYGRRSKKARAAKNKAKRFARCGKYADGQYCRACSKKRFRLIADCDLRVCPRCERVRSRSRARALELVVEDLRAQQHVHHRADGKVESYKLRMLTCTLRFDVADPNEFTPRAIEKKLGALHAATRVLWEELRRDDERPRRPKLPHATLFWNLEVSAGGAVHFHSAVWGVFKPGLDRLHVLYRRELRRWGYDGNFDLKPTKRRKRADGTWSNGCEEICKYVVKGSTPRRMVPLAGEARMMDPALATAVELALIGKHVCGGWGAFRCVNKLAEELEEKARPEGHVDAHDACPCCGVVGELEPVFYVRTEELHPRFILGCAKPAGAPQRGEPWAEGRYLHARGDPRAP